MSQRAEPDPERTDLELPELREPPERRRHSAKTFLIELATITAGVLIALSIEGLREWNHYRTLVREARATIAVEIAANKKELDEALTSMTEHQKELSNALDFADQMLNEKKSSIRTVVLRYTLADLSTASWETAERTGALAHMDYGEVRDLSALYGYQQLFAERQRRIVDRVGEASAVLSGRDPHQAPPQDLEMFRQQVLTLRGELVVQEDFGRQLSAQLAKMLAR